MTQPFKSLTRRQILQHVHPAFLFAGLLAATMGLKVSQSATEGARAIPAPALDEQVAPAATSEVAILAGGCFWGVQGVFQHVKGVTSAVSGYAGGDKKTAQYNTVSSGTTTVRARTPEPSIARQSSLRLRSRRVSLRPIWSSSIRCMCSASPSSPAPKPARGFYPAEGYHQDFLTRNPDYPYIVINDLLKNANLKRLFPENYRADPVLVAAPQSPD